MYRLSEILAIQAGYPDIVFHDSLSSTRLVSSLATSAAQHIARLMALPCRLWAWPRDREHICCSTVVHCQLKHPGKPRLPACSPVQHNIEAHAVSSLSEAMHRRSHLKHTQISDCSYMLFAGHLHQAHLVPDTSRWEEAAWPTCASHPVQTPAALLRAGLHIYGLVQGACCGDTCCPAGPRTRCRLSLAV